MLDEFMYRLYNMYLEVPEACMAAGQEGQLGPWV